MKKIISLLAVVALVACLATAAFAAEACTLTIDSVETSAGETVTLNVVIDVNPGVTAVSLAFTADEGLELVEISADGHVLEGATVNAATGKVSYAASSANTGVGTLLTLTYKVADDAANGEYKVTATGKLVNNEGGTRVQHDMTVVAGVVTVSCAHEYTKEITTVADCCTTGVITYTCSKCGDTYTEEYYDTANHIAKGHVEAVAATCWENGNLEYWYCDACGLVCLDEAMTLVTNRMSVVVPAAHTVVHVEAVEPTCFEEGNIEYWYCSVCETVWVDEDLTQISNFLSVKLAPKHNIIHVEAVEPTCEEMGNLEYWYCDICGYAWLDELCWYNTNLQAVKLPALGHDYVIAEQVDATCTEDGYIIWVCQNDEAHTYTEVIPATGHSADCGHDIPAETGDTISVAVAAVIVSAMGIVALPLVKKHF